MFTHRENMKNKKAVDAAKLSKVGDEETQGSFEYEKAKLTKESTVGDESVLQGTQDDQHDPSFGGNETSGKKTSEDLKIGAIFEDLVPSFGPVLFSGSKSSKPSSNSLALDKSKKEVNGPIDEASMVGALDKCKIVDLVDDKISQIVLEKDGKRLIVERSKMPFKILSDYDKKMSRKFFEENKDLDIIDEQTSPDVLAMFRKLKPVLVTRNTDDSYDVTFRCGNKLEVEGAMAKDMYPDLVIAALKKIVKEMRRKKPSNKTARK